MSQHRLHRSHKLLEQAATSAEHPVYLVVHATLQEEVHDANIRVLLPDTIDTTDALLDPAGIPRQIVVDNGTGRLEVQTLTRCVSANKNLNLTFLQRLGD